MISGTSHVVMVVIVVMVVMVVISLLRRRIWAPRVPAHCTAATLLSFRATRQHADSEGCSRRPTGRSVRAGPSGAQAAPTSGVRRSQLAAIEESQQYCSSVVWLKFISAHRHSGSNVSQA